MNKPDAHWSVYKLTCVSTGKSYIGLTRYLRVRKWVHSKGDRKCLLIGNAVKKYGWGKFEFVVLGTYATAADAAVAEQLFIRFYGTKKPNGYNICDGGEGALGRQQPEKQKRAVSAALRGRKAYWITPAHLERLRSASAVSLADPDKHAAWREKIRQKAFERWALKKGHR